MRLLACFITITILFGHKALPEKRKLISPLLSNETILYADGDWGGLSTASWVDQSMVKWLCSIRESEQQPVCGMSISFMGAGGKALDFSGYERLEFNVKYSGKADKLRLYLRNHNPAYSSMDDSESFKFNGILLSTAELKSKTTVIDLNELTVADWWIEQHNIPREHSQVEYTNIIAFGFDIPPPNIFGEHLVSLSKAELVGEWISAEMLYLVIIIAWMTAIIIEAAVRLLALFRRSSLDTSKIRHLTDYANALQEQTDLYKELSTHDALTGVFNRNGIAKVIDDLFTKNSSNTDVAVLLLDIDHFKRVNDKRGHDMGDVILKEFAKIISENIRPKDAFARWGGEEFIIVSPGTSLTAAAKFAEKLRVNIAAKKYGVEEISGISASFGVTVARIDDTFEDAFKRADVALYRAKELKRNCVVVEE